jgi:hypothetical protein
MKKQIRELVRLAEQKDREQFQKQQFEGAGTVFVLSRDNKYSELVTNKCPVRGDVIVAISVNGALSSVESIVQRFCEKYNGLYMETYYN